MLGQERDDLIDAEAVGLEPEALVLLVAPDQGVHRVTGEATGQRSQLVRVQALGDEQVLAHPDLVACVLERVERVDGGRAVRVVKQREGHDLKATEPTVLRPPATSGQLVAGALKRAPRWADGAAMRLRPSLYLTAAALAAGALLPATSVAHPGHDHSRIAPEQAPRGKIYEGLRDKAGDRCGDLLAVEGTTLCTHGPDQAPADVDVRNP